MTTIFNAAHSITLCLETCLTCDLKFGVDSEFLRKRKEDHKNFYCPNGHGQHYPGLSENEKLRQEIEKLEQRVQFRDNTISEKNHTIEQLNYSVRAQKAAKTKIINRVKNGVCPCCNRSFANLQNHFKTVHPELLKP